MSSPVSSEHIAPMRDDARRLVRGAGHQETQLEGLVRAAYTADPALPEVLVDRLSVAVLPKPSTPDAVLAAVQNLAGP